MDYKQYFDGKTQSLSTTQYVNDMDIKMAIYISGIVLGEWLDDEKSDVRGQPVFGMEFSFNNYIERVCGLYCSFTK